MKYSQEYLEYLKSSQWKERCTAKLEQANYRCQKCGERDGLEVHHKTYDRLGHERSDDLVVLCRSCHWAADEKRRGKFWLEKKLKAPRQKSPEQKLSELEMRGRAGRAAARRIRRKRNSNHARS